MTIMSGLPEFYITEGIICRYCLAIRWMMNDFSEFLPKLCAENTVNIFRKTKVTLFQSFKISDSVTFSVILSASSDTPP